MDDKIIYLSVSALNSYIEKKYKFDPYLKEVYIKGEVSNCKLHSNGNLYFTIKDNKTKIDATKFKGAEYAHLKEGDTVYVKASLNFFMGFGQQRLTVQEIKLDSVGDLYRRLIELRDKLSKEGIFSSIHKKRVPRFSNNIAVITSATGAAIQDIKRTILRRYPIANINVYSSLVQGDQAINDIIKNLKIADNDNNDVIILARGGGSIEDLWSFNSEEVVRAVFACKTPIVTGVGHETDTTLVDYVADIRASTPTAAAEIVTPYTIDDIKNHVSLMSDKMIRLINEKVSRLKKDLLSYSNSYIIKNYNYREYEKLLNFKTEKINNLINNKILIKRNYLEKNVVKFKSIDLMNYYTNKFNLIIENFENNSPLGILKKGYSITYSSSGEKISSTEAVSIGDSINIKFNDGDVTAEVINISKNEVYHDEK